MKKALFALGISIMIVGLCSCDKAQTAETEIETATTAVVSEETTTEETETTTEETTKETTVETTKETIIIVETEEPEYTLPSEVEENMSDNDKAIILENMKEADPEKFETQEIKDYINENIYNANYLFARIYPDEQFGIEEGVITITPYSETTYLHYVIKFDTVENAMNYFDPNGEAEANGLHIVFVEEDDGSMTMNIDEQGFELDATISPNAVLEYTYKSKA